MFILTLFVHDEFIDNKLLYTIVHVACHIYIMQQGSKKLYLYSLMAKHRLWKSSFVWRDCIHYNIN